MRVVLYTGKGGVGKTTTAAATAVRAARRGRRTLVASADSAHSLGDVADARIGPRPVALEPNLDAVEVDARIETERHWGAIHEYLFRVFRYQGIEDVVADELALLPGAEELTTLLAVEAFAREGAYDLIVVDCAPTDSALRLLTLPEVASGGLRFLLRLQRAVTAVLTPLARSVVALPLPDSAVFRDAERLIYRRLDALRQFVSGPATTTRLVVTPERMVIDEALRAHTDLALFGLACDAVVMNRLLPPGAAEEPWFRDWAEVQEERLAEVEEAFAPLPVLRAPLQDDEVVGLERLASHGAALFGRRAPDARLARGAGLRFDATPGGGRVRIPMPRAPEGGLDVAKLDESLVLTTAARRRLLPLPRKLRALELASARVEAGELVVELVPRAEATPCG